MVTKVLIVGGTFDEQGGKPSGLINKMFGLYVDPGVPGIEAVIKNGGDMFDLSNVFSRATNSNTQIVIWFANVPNSYDKLILGIKKLNPSCILVESKRNNDEYSPQEIVAHALKNKANLVVEFSQVNGIFAMKVTDPLGNCWCQQTPDYRIVSDTIMNQAKYLKGITRKNTILLPDDLIKDVPVPEGFLNLVRSYGETFHNLINPAEGTRFLGNSSFRCESGFPSFRDRSNNVDIFVTKRNIDKRNIAAQGFVGVVGVADKILVYGPYKPSVDTPIQLALYKKYPEINYMLHSHVFIDSAPFTENFVPCGGLEEIDEISKVYEKTKSKYINLIGHGSIVLAGDLIHLANIKYIKRF